MDRLAHRFIEEEPRHRIGDVAGVEIAATRGWWVPPLAVLAAGQVLGRLLGSGAHPVRDGLEYGVAIGAAGLIHQAGHIVTSRMVEAPMDTLLLTPIRVYTLYDDTGKTITRDQHVGRSIGGPAANILTGLAALALSLVVDHRVMRFFGISSVLFGLASLAPTSGNDGEVIFARSTEE